MHHLFKAEEEQSQVQGQRNNERFQKSILRPKYIGYYTSIYTESNFIANLFFFSADSVIDSGPHQVNLLHYSTIIWLFILFCNT